MANLLNTPVDFKITPTGFGTWKRYLYQSGMVYQEFTSHRHVGTWPLVQFKSGRNPETGTVGTARGIIAVGRRAVGFVAIGQLAVGFLAFGQASFGVFALGQLGVGLLAGIGQAAVGVVAIGQLAAGVFCVGQLALGGWILAQFGVGQDLLNLLRRE
jgi:hypothetical protein